MEEQPKRRGRPPGSKNKPRIRAGMLRDIPEDKTKMAHVKFGWCITGHHQDCVEIISCGICSCGCHKKPGEI